jgi:SAM-dependent methyltransferase
MPDALFSDPRLVALYDFLDDDRSDLEHYLAMASEFGAVNVLDVGCGTGTFACLLAQTGCTVTGVDPAAASVDVASRKAGAERVRWVIGEVGAVGAVQVDLVTMTGNVAQVFVDDQEWASTIGTVRELLAPGGRFVFEVRDPAREAWLGWTREQTEKRIEVPGIGGVRQWFELTDVRLPLVSFRGVFVFEQRGEVLTSDSTLRFRQRAEVEASLADAGLVIEEVRDAPDRPGLEFVFIARRR